MYKSLVVALLGACMINMICLCCHLSRVIGPATGPVAGSATTTERLASSLGSRQWRDRTDE